MILADKIIELRRRNDWTQDDLAERLDVSRQSVSKWEGGLAYPGLDKIVEMSRIFGVSTDYLLKDETDEPRFSDTPPAFEPAPPARRLVTLEEANEFLAVKAATAKPMAWGVLLCILSPVCLLFLGGCARYWRPMNEYTIVGIGLLVLFALVIPAVAIFVSCGMKTSKFEYMEKEVFDTAYGVTHMARERMEQDRETHTRRNVLGICLCIASAIPTLVASFMEFTLWGVCATLAMVAMGVHLILLAGIPWGSYQMLLQEGDYSPERKGSLFQSVSSIYWCVVTAGYLGYSLITDRWDRSWIIYAVAGVLYAGLTVLLIAIDRRRSQR